MSFSAQQATVLSRTLSHAIATPPSPMLTVIPAGTLIVGDLLKAAANS